MSDNGEDLLLERDVQLAQLERLIADVEGGSGGLTLIEGSPGIGKTRLLTEACTRARGRGFIVLSARGGEVERDFAFGIVRQLLEPVLNVAEPDHRERLMAGAARFCEPVFAEPASGAQHSGDPSYAILHGLYWLLSNLAECAPTLIAIDDAHWVDRPSLRFVAFAARRLEGTALLIAVAGRRGEPGAEADLVRGLRQELGERPVEPGRLSEEAVARLVRSRLGPKTGDALCGACHEATRGNPFLLSELLVELGDRAPGPIEPATVRQLAPRGVAAAVLARLGRLPPGAAALARAVAVLGEQAELSHAAALAGLELKDARAAAARLAEAAILDRGRPLRFVHPIVRSTIHESVPEADRSDAHARAARLLAREEMSPDAIALQLLGSEPAADEWVVETLREAARGAARRGAPEVAARYLRRALSEPPHSRAQVLVDLGGAEARAGEPGAREHLAAARDLATEPWLETQATIELAQVLSYEGKTSEATTLALQTLDAMRDNPDVARAMKTLLLVFAEIDLAARRLTGAVVLRARRTVERLGESAPRSLMAVMAFETAMVDGTAEHATDLAERALADGRLVEEQTAEAPHPYVASMALVLAGRDEIAERELSVGLAEALERGSARGFGLASAVRAWSRCRRGALDGAEADARAFLSVAGQPGSDHFRPLALSALVDVLVERGELAAASAALAEWDVGPRATGTCPSQPLRASRARLRLAEGRPRDALVELTAYARWEQEWGATTGVFVQWRSAAAIAHAALGDTTRARHLRMTSYGAPGVSARRARSGSASAPPDSSRAASRGSCSSMKRSPAWSAPTHGSSLRAPWSGSEARSAAQAAAPRLASPCAQDLTSPGASVPPRSRRPHTRSSSPPVRVRAAHRSPAATRSRPANDGSPRWPPPARPTARSPSRCSSP